MLSHITFSNISHFHHKTFSATKRSLHKTFSKQNVAFTKLDLHNICSTTKRFLILHFHHKTFPYITTPPQNVHATKLDLTFHKKFHLSNVSLKKCFLKQNVSFRKIFPVTKCFLSLNFFCRKMFPVAKCFLSQNVSYH